MRKTLTTLALISFLSHGAAGQSPAGGPAPRGGAPDPPSRQGGGARTVSGVVLSQLNELAPGVSVTARTPSGERRAETDPEGYFRLESPRLAQKQWADTFDPSVPASAGNVSARHGGAAVVAFTSGAVDALSIEDLRDMRHWANAADSHDWHLAP